MNKTSPLSDYEWLITNKDLKRKLIIGRNTQRIMNYWGQTIQLPPPILLSSGCLREVENKSKFQIFTTSGRGRLSNFTRKLLVFWKTGRSRELVATEGSTVCWKSNPSRHKKERSWQQFFIPLPKTVFTMGRIVSKLVANWSGRIVWHSQQNLCLIVLFFS